jgi:hypothetical protein
MDEDVNRSDERRCGSGDAMHGLFVSHVEREAVRLAACDADLLDGARELDLSTRHEDDARSFAREARCDLPPQPAAGSGHQGGCLS